MYYKAIIPSNVVYYETDEPVISVNLHTNAPLDASGNEISYKKVMVQLTHTLDDSYAIISEVTDDPFPIIPVIIESPAETTNSEI
jgi:hypothetical protein